MNQTVLEVVRPAVPADVIAAYESLGKEFTAWGPEVSVTQKQVDLFVELTGDDNPIHKAGNPTMPPILPGFFELALLPQLLQGNLPLKIPGHVILNRKVECEFKRPVRVGAGLCMRYRPDALKKERVGFTARFEYEIAFADTKKTTAQGFIYLFVQ